MRSHETTSLLFYTEPNNLRCFCDKIIFLALEKEARPKAFFMNCKFWVVYQSKQTAGVWWRRPPTSSQIFLRPAALQIHLCVKKGVDS